MPPRPPDIAFAWCYSILLWITTYPVASPLINQGIDSLSFSELSIPLLYIVPNIFFTIGLITVQARLFQPIIAAHLLLAGISLGRAGCETMVLLGNFYAKLRNTDSELPLWSSLQTVFMGLLGCLTCLGIAGYLQKLMEQLPTEEILFYAGKIRY